MEMRYEKKWLPISGHTWNIYGSSVVCRSLGFPLALSADAVYPEEHRTRSGFVSDGSPYLDVDCNGSEHDVTECRVTASKQTHALKVAHVVCGEGKTLLQYLNNRV